MYVWVCMCGVYNLVGCKACMHNIFVKDERTNERHPSNTNNNPSIESIHIIIYNIIIFYDVVMIMMSGNL